MMALWLLACSGGLDPAGEGTDDTSLPWTTDDSGAPGGSSGSADPWVGGDCEPDVSVCAGGDCPPAPSEIQHDAWLNRLTQSPVVGWEVAGEHDGVQLSIGTKPGDADVWCWEDATGESFQFTALWLEDATTYYVNLRTVSGDVVSETVSSEGWTTDVVAPEAVESVSDFFATVHHTVSWTGDGADAASGFSHYEVAFGSFPGASDLIDWTPTNELEATFSMEDMVEDQWAYASVRTVDAAGNQSIEVTSEGFIRCPDNYAYVPPNDNPYLETDGFCLAKYEMRADGYADGNIGYVDKVLPVSIPDGTPWANLIRQSAVYLCNQLGNNYTLVSLRRYQAVSRSIENTGENWSGGEVGQGYVNRGHHDDDPSEAIAASTDDDPCFGTNNPSCTDPEHDDWNNKRTHVLANGELIWDWTGNVREHVDGSAGFQDGGLWTSYDDDAFNDVGKYDNWEENRALFGPEGPYSTEHGMGQIYAGDGNLLRGGAWTGYSQGSAGSAGPDDVGLYYGHHHVWSLNETQGFRCTYSP